MISARPKLSALFSVNFHLRNYDAQSEFRADPVLSYGWACFNDLGILTHNGRNKEKQRGTKKQTNKG